MSDTLVIVIAQSGTTVDTNVYVQMAKDRGAYSLAIANKREGDVTFIVSGTSYIGEGRDIEIAVPSTKTYTAQVALGYIISTYFATSVATEEADKSRLLTIIKNLKDMVLLIEDSISSIDKCSVMSDITEAALKFQSWYVLRDASTNSVCAEEIRIKFSENCYHSVSSLTLNDALILGVNNSFLLFITEEPLSNLSEKLTKILDKGNLVAIISPHYLIDKKLESKVKQGSLFVINMPSSPEHFSFIPTIIAGQFLSYFQAVELNKRSDYLKNLISNMENETEQEASINQIESAIDAGIFNQGYSTGELKLLKEIALDLRINKIDLIEQDQARESLIRLAEQSRRTIDTIKHQAKTITVGAVREASSEIDVLSLSHHNINFESEARKGNC